MPGAASPSAHVGVALLERVVCLAVLLLLALAQRLPVFVFRISLRLRRILGQFLQFLVLRHLRQDLRALAPVQDAQPVNDLPVRERCLDAEPEFVLQVREHLVEHVLALVCERLLCRRVPRRGDDALEMVLREARAQLLVDDAGQHRLVEGVPLPLLPHLGVLRGPVVEVLAALADQLHEPWLGAVDDGGHRCVAAHGQGKPLVELFNEGL